MVVGREDILCAAHSAGSSGPSLLATGDYEGRINLYDTRSGERRLSLYHRAARYCTAIQCLLFLRPPGAAQHLYLLSCGGTSRFYCCTCKQDASAFWPWHSPQNVVYQVDNAVVLRVSIKTLKHLSSYSPSLCVSACVHRM